MTRLCVYTVCVKVSASLFSWLTLAGLKSVNTNTTPSGLSVSRCSLYPIVRLYFLSSIRHCRMHRLAWSQRSAHSPPHNVSSSENVLPRTYTRVIVLKWLVMELNMTKRRLNSVWDLYCDSTESWRSIWAHCSLLSSLFIVLLTQSPAARANRIYFIVNIVSGL